MDVRRSTLFLTSLILAAGFSVEASGFINPFSDRGSRNNQTIKVGAGMINYSGEDSKSLSGKKGFSGEIVTEQGSRVFSVIGKVRGESSSASAKFIDGAVESTLNYQLMMGEALLGVKIGLIPSDVFTPYLSGAGVLGLANLTFSSSNLSTLNKSETTMAYGYEVGAGADLRFDDFIIWAEIQSRVSSGRMAGQGSFALDGLRLVIGVGW